MKVTKTPIIKTPTLRKRRVGERRVRFSAPSAVCEKSFLSQEEIENTWYSRDEERSFKQDAVRTLNDYKRRAHFEAMKGIDSTEFVPRGLERHTRERRTHKKELVKWVVFFHKQGFHPDDIALFSQKRSRWNTVTATTQASIDQLEVMVDEQQNSGSIFR